MELKWAAAVAGILLIVLCIWLVAMFIKWLSSLDWRFESASERAGRHGEEIAAEIISRVLREGDHLLTNIEIMYDGRGRRWTAASSTNSGRLFSRSRITAVSWRGMKMIESTKPPAMMGRIV